jgi:hypothetical protein
MSEARIDRIANENNTAGPIISGITTFSGQNFFVPPKGTQHKDHQTAHQVQLDLILTLQN